MSKRIVISLIVFAWLAVAWLALGANPDNAKTDGVWPTSVTRVDSSSTQTAYLVEGLIGDEWKWRPFSNRVTRKLFRAFGTADSVFYDERGRALITTDRQRSEIPELIDWLAAYTGEIPTWEELVTRDLESEEYRSWRYRLVSRFDTEGLGGGFLYCGSEFVGEDKLSLTFRNAAYTDSLGVYSLDVSWRIGAGAAIDFALSERIDSAELKKYPRFVPPVESEVVIPVAEIGWAKLSAVTAHCKGHMRFALRVYDSSGLFIWCSNEEIAGDVGLWVVDLNGDGAGELVVSSVDHGRINIFVYAEKESI